MHNSQGKNVWYCELFSEHSIIFMNIFPKKITESPNVRRDPKLGRKFFEEQKIFDFINSILCEQ